MSDGDQIVKLLALASDNASLQEAQHVAARKLLAMDGEHYPADGCAITQSALLQAAGIAVPDTFLAFAFGQMLEERGWLRVPVGKQHAGDIGSTCKSEPDHGSDHVYLVLRAVNDDEMVVADNQATVPHMRYASGKGGKTPTTHFLRAPGDSNGKPVAYSGTLSGPLPPPLTGAPSKAGAILAPTPSKLAPEEAMKRILSVLKEMVEGTA